MHLYHAMFLAILESIYGYKLAPQSADVLRAEPAMALIETVVQERVQEHEREDWARIVFTFGKYESNLQANPKCKPGKDCNDDSRACGFGQVHDPERIIPGATCSKVRGDLKLGIVVTLEIMQRLTRQCGSREAGLTAYAMFGKCESFVLPLVKRRCLKAGLSEHCTAL